MKDTTTTLWIVIILILSPLFTKAQNGPGNIGNIDGSNGQPELYLWLLPDSLGLSDGNDVLSWTDYSGKEQDLSAASSTSPIFKAGGLNGHDYLEFSKDNNRIVRNPFDMPTDAVSVFMVMRTSDTGDALLSYNASGAENNYLFYDLQSFRTYVSGNNSSSNQAINNGNWSIFSHQWRNSDGRLYLHLNGNSLQATTHQSGANLTANGALAIAGEQDGVDAGYSAAQDYDGDIAEVILFGSSLKQAQRVVIENYLAQKYGLDASLSVDLFVPADVSYVHALTGMGMESDRTTGLSSEGLVITQNGNFDNGEYIFAAHNSAVNSINTSPGVLYPEIEAAWQRDWYLDKTGTVDAKIAFDFSEGINGDFPANIENYRLLYKSSLGSSYDTIAVANRGVQNDDQVYFEVNDANLADGYYTLGTVDQSNSPLDGTPGRTWYTLRSTANWDSPEAWTLEPCGCLPNNPNGYTPITSPTAGADKVVILSGKKITVPVGVTNLNNNELVVEGELDLQTTTGHAFGSIKGGGLISMGTDNFPLGDASDFVTAGEGEGKVEFYGNNYTIAANREFFNVDVILDNASSSITLLADLKVNGDLRIEEGILKLNDDASTTTLNVSVGKELFVASTSQILTGTANARHQLDLYGDLTNQGGVVKFTNRTAAGYSSDATDGIVDVNFLNNTADQVVTCNGTTNFYRIEIDKGTDKTYVVSINASEVANFNLFGRANDGHGSTSQLTTNDNALGLIRGTARIGQNIIISNLNTASNYNVSAGARLWIDGGEVTKSNGTAIVPYGELKVSAGVLNAKVNSGITLRDNGIINIEGGLINANQIRTSTLGVEHQGGYKQSGGIVNIVGGSTSSDYYVFNLTHPGNSFQMSGGTLKIHEANSKGGVFINSSEANYSVTGGTLICNIGNNRDFVITSKAPFYNLIFEKTASNSNVFVLNDGVDVGSTNVDLPAQPLVVLNDFRIRGEESGTGYPDITFEAVTAVDNVNDLYVGGSMFLEEGTNYVFAFEGTFPFDCVNRQPSQTNTTFFNKTAGTSAIDTLYWGHPGTDNKLEAEQRLEIGHFVLNRTSGNTLRTVGRENLNNTQILTDVNGNASVLSGTLDQGRMTFRTWGKIVNHDRMGTNYTSGPYPTNNGTPNTAQIRFREDPPVEIETKSGAIFGNIRFNVNPNRAHVTLTSDVKIERMEFMRGAIYLKGYNLTIDDMWNLRDNNDYFVDGSSLINVDVDGITANRLIYTDGHAGDGGLSLLINQNTRNPENNGSRDGNYGPVSFPIGFTPDEGTTIYHRPAQLKVKDFQDEGYVTIRPVSGPLQTTQSTGGEILQQYWRVTHDGFDNVPTVAMRFYYFDQTGVAGVDLPAGASNENNYVPGYVLDEAPYTRYFESNPVTDVSDVVNSGTSNQSRQIVFNDSSTGGEFTQAGFTGFPLINASFTAGESPRFVGAPEVYYSRFTGGYSGKYWDDLSAWSTTGFNGTVASSRPQAGDIVNIGYGGGGSSNNQHYIIVRSGHTEECAMLNFIKNPNTGQRNGRIAVQEGTNSIATIANFNMIKGEGEFNVFIRTGRTVEVNGDFGDFAKNLNSSFLYKSQNNATHIIPASFPKEYPNLGTEFAGTFVFPFDVTINGRFNTSGGNSLMFNDGAKGDFTIHGDLRAGGYLTGKIFFPNNGTPRTINVGGNVELGWVHVLNYQVNNDCELSVMTGGTESVVHSLKVAGGINITGGNRGTRNAKFDLFDNNSGGANVILELIGDTGKVFSSAAQTNPDLYRIRMNKGNNSTPSFTFNTNFSLGGPTSGAGVAKAIDLQNGKLVFNHPDIDINLTTGNDPFYIPATSGLELLQGRAVANGGSGISLNGKLFVSGGTLDMSGGDNPIIYSVSGNAAIEVTDGTLLVGSQIRRPDTDDLGVLKYTQSGGDVQIGVSSGGLASRAMLEVLNTGSLFNHTGGTLTILRQNTASPSTPALHLEPSGYALQSSTIQIFNGSTPAGQNKFGINSAVPLNNLIINGTGNPTVNLEVRPLSLVGDLTIESGATLDAKGFRIDLKGDWNNTGTFVPSGNEVLFTGSEAQIINGNTNFYSLTKESEGILSLGASTDINVDYLLTVSDGSFDEGGNSIFVKRDIINNALLTSSASGNGVVLNGTSLQRIFGNGSYDKLWLDNSAGFTQEEGNVITIRENLQMENGILNIGKNLIVFDESATINTTTGFSNSNMIQTNISFVDAGLKKFLPTGALNFTYPLGSGGFYTPVSLNITGNTATGAYLRVKGAKEIHPSVIDLPATPMHEPLNVLAYYWVLDANGLTDFAGDISMSYPNSLVQVESGYSYNDYITARLLSRGTGDWNKDIGTVDVVNHKLTFDFNGTDDGGITGDYTAGIDEAIPDQVPTYTSIKDGNWNDVTVWSPAPPTGGPRGAIVAVNHDVSIPVDYISSYRTNINGDMDGRVLIPGTEGHRLGNVSGTGTLYLETGALPAGDYTAFLVAGGGTLEFGGTGKNYPVLGGILEVNNLKFSGSGIRELSNAGLQILGDLSIESSGLLLVDNKYDKDITVKGDIAYNSGSFDAGKGTLRLNGSSNQLIGGTGSFTGSNALYNVTINNSAGVRLALPMEVSRVLTLTNGKINTEAGSLTLTYSEVNALLGGSSTSYVEGPMAKYINNNEHFNFPIGQSGRYGMVSVSNTNTSATGLWEAHYFNQNPAGAGLDPNSFISPVEFVSRSEYWRVKGPNAATANVAIRWDVKSGISADALERQKLRIVSWEDRATDAWQEAGKMINDGGQTMGTIRTDNPAIFNEFGVGNYFTLGAVVVYNYPWLGNTTDWFDVANWDSGTVPSSNTEVEIPTSPTGGSFPIIDGDAYCLDLNINTSAEVTLKPGASLEITNSLVNDGKFLLESDFDNLSSLMVPEGNTDAGQAQIKLNGLPANHWNYLGHPIQTPTAGIYDVTNKVYKIENKWMQLTNSSTVLNPLEGVAVWYDTTHNLDYTGTLNSGAVTHSFIWGKGYYIMSNPYPTAIDWQKNDGNGWTRTDISPSIWHLVYINEGQDYIFSYNRATGVAQIIPTQYGYTSENISHIAPYQSVWIKLDGEATSGTVSVDNKARNKARVRNTLSLKSGSRSKGNFELIRFVTRGNDLMDGGVLYFREDFTSGTDFSDTEKKFNSSKSFPEIYTRSGSTAMAINGLPTLTDEEYSFPLSVRNRVEGEVTLSVDLQKFDNSYTVFLEDKTTGVWTNLRENADYVYTPAKMGDTHDRFVLHLKNVTTSVVTPEDIGALAGNGITITAYRNHAKISIAPEILQQSNGKAIIEVADVNGRILENITTVEVGTEVALPRSSGVYLVRVKAGPVVISQKIAVQKQ